MMKDYADPFDTPGAVVGNLTFQIVSKIGSRIATGYYPPGTVLPPEAQLCEEFNTSRTVLREAVKMLTAKGLIDARPRRGTIVRPESHWNLADADILNWMLHRRNVLPLIIEFNAVRLAIEPAAAALAARDGTPEAKEHILTALQRMDAANDGEDDALDADIAFHAGILHASNNRFFWSLRHMIEVALRFSIRITNLRKGVENASVEDHRRIYDSIMAGDSARAEAEMRALLLEAQALLLEAERASETDSPETRSSR